MNSTSQNTTITAPLVEEIPQPEQEAPAEENTYGQILKSSALIGGSQVLKIGIGIIRTKVMAVLLGPAGFGLMGLYGSIVDLAVNIAGMGVNSSGVRQIAESVGTGDAERIAQTVIMLRKTTVFLGIFGAILLVLFSRQISILTFGSEQRTGAVALLSLAVLFRLVSAGQGALIQGVRRIGDLAIMGVLGAILGTAISIILVYYMGEQGVAPSLIGFAAMGFILSWWYSKKIKIQLPAMTSTQMKLEAVSLLKLGFVFMASGFFMMGAAYTVRIIVTRNVGLDAAGYYQSAWTLGGLYVGFILEAMGADFYPRLTGVATNNTQCNRMVNEQAQISLLMAGPGVITTLTFAEIVISLLYSSKFDPAVGILRWICLGMTLRVITWPIGFIIIAKNAKNLFFLTELAWTVVNVGLSWIFVNSFGLNGAGIAFFGSYVFHGFMIYPIVRRLSGFRWSKENLRTGLVYLSLIAMVFCGFYVLPAIFAICLGVTAVILSVIFSIKVIATLVAFDRIPNSIRWVIVKLGFARSWFRK